MSVDAKIALETGLDLEVTQATQDVNNSVPLIAGKPTFVRVHVACDPDGQVPPGASVALRGYGSSGELPGSPRAPFGGYLSTACREGLEQQRADLRKTFNFAAPNEWAQGTITLRAEVGERSGEATVSFQESRSLRVSFIPVEYRPPLTSWLCNTPGQPSERIWTAYSWSQRVLPTSKIEVDRLPSMPFSRPLSEGLLCLGRNDVSENQLFNELITWNTLKNTGSGYIYGWLPSGAYGGGLSRITLASNNGPSLGGQVAFGDDNPPEGPRIFAHELGHLLRRPEIDKACGVPSEGYRDWPYDPDRHVREYGVDISEGSFVLKRPNENYD